MKTLGNVIYSLDDVIKNVPEHAAAARFIARAEQSVVNSAERRAWPRGNSVRDAIGIFQLKPAAVLEANAMPWRLTADEDRIIRHVARYGATFSRPSSFVEAAELGWASRKYAAIADKLAELDGPRTQAAYLTWLVRTVRRRHGEVSVPLLYAFHMRSPYATREQAVQTVRKEGSAYARQHMS